MITSSYRFAIVRVGACLLGLVACTERPAADPAQRAQANLTSQPGANPTYEAVRDEYRRTLAAREKRGEHIEAAEDSALRRLESLLRPVVGDFSAPGIVGPGRINLQTLLPGSEDSGLPDGMLYLSRDSTVRVLVTTDDLLRSWIARTFDRDTVVSRDPRVALGSDDVLTQLFDVDAHVDSYMDIPVDSAPLGVVSAKLVTRSQDYSPSPADEVIVSVARGHRLFIIDSPARDTLPTPPECRAAADSGSARSTSLRDSALSATPKRGALVDAAWRNDDLVNAQFRRCYGESVGHDPRFRTLIAQVRRLVESLPAR